MKQLLALTKLMLLIIMMKCALETDERYMRYTDKSTHVSMPYIQS